MSLKIGLNLTENYSINFSSTKRGKKQIQYIILHYTGMKKESKAIEKLCDEKSKVSSHYFIRNTGKVLRLVPDLYEAWHAGKSSWKNLKSLNKNSIGIEINNPGHQHGYKKFDRKQISSLKKLLKYLIKKYSIKKKNILGHSDIAPYRKKDPGEKFPWSELYRYNLCHGHNLNKKNIKKFRKIKLNLIEQRKFLKNLYKMGYSRFDNRLFNKKKSILVKAFQRRFRQDLIDGKIDKECFLISKNL
jgi:N-acetylmuramoyl-L-alanine amidase